MNQEGRTSFYVRNHVYLYEVFVLIESDTSISVRRIVETNIERCTDPRELTWDQLDKEVQDKIMTELTKEDE